MIKDDGRKESSQVVAATSVEIPGGSLHCPLSLSHRIPVSKVLRSHLKYTLSTFSFIFVHPSLVIKKTSF